MIQLLHSTSRGIGDAALRAMFVARKQVFVDLLKWDVPVLSDRFEIDQFDDEHATYLILTDGEGAHLGSTRLLPTTRPHILGDLFASLCEAESPRGADTYEITRFCLDRGLTAQIRRVVRDTLIGAIVDHALDHGIRTYTAIAAMGWFQQILGFGWRCRPLGMPRRIGDDMLGALAIEIDTQTPDALFATGLRPVRAAVIDAARVAA